jgi:hypothetical protein
MQTCNTNSVKPYLTAAWIWADKILLYHVTRWQLFNFDLSTNYKQDRVTIYSSSNLSVVLCQLNHHVCHDIIPFYVIKLLGAGNRY